MLTLYSDHILFHVVFEVMIIYAHPVLRSYPTAGNLQIQLYVFELISMSRNDTAIKDRLIQTEKEMFHLGLRNKCCEKGIQFVSAVPSFQVKNN